MNKQNNFLCVNEDFLLLDIGSGTQDVLLAHAHTNYENWTRFVLPSPAMLIAQKIQACTIAQKLLVLTGTNMGGGFLPAIQAHIDANLSVIATPHAASSLYDDLSRVENIGVTIMEEDKLQEHIAECPHEKIKLSDFSKDFWTDYLQKIGMTIPKKILIAAQDHGIHKDVGNRTGRFLLWKEALQANNNPIHWIFHDVPAPYTRLQALKDDAQAFFIADTGTAALLGALSEPEIRERSRREGILIVNVGNSHVIAFLVYQGAVYGIYEHHTDMHTTVSLMKDLAEFRLGWLPHEQVREAGGHGCVFQDIPPTAEGFRPTYIIGPRRELLLGAGQFIAPQGDMMLAGAFGLLYGYDALHNQA